MNERRNAGIALAMSTLAFTACFAVWMMNGVLVTFLVENRIFAFSRVQVGWLIGIPVLTGSIVRLPVGILTDRFGGRLVYTVVMVLGAAGCFLLSTANSFAGFVVGSLGFGLAGTSFAVGIAYTSAWFSKERQGTALGVFGTGNAGSAVTSIAAPLILARLTRGGAHPEGWRMLPVIYGIALIAMALLFWLLAKPRRTAAAGKPLREQLSVLASVRVWRFGLYYFLVFGCFVALAQWLIPYYVNVFGVSLAFAGMLAAVFSFPSGVIRALGGWMSDRFGARATMYGVLGCCTVGCLMLSFPPMDIRTPGEGVLAFGRGVVTAVSDNEIVVGQTRYSLKAPPPAAANAERGFLPRTIVAQQAVVKVGDRVVRKQLLARGVTQIAFHPNIWVFTVIVFVVGIAMGIGKAAVYKHIPDYFPTQVGVVGGLVGVIGGLGGFVCPILFAYFLGATGLWTTCWVFLFFLSLGSLFWMHSVIRSMEQTRLQTIEESARVAEARARAPVAAAEPLGVEVAAAP